MKIDWKGLGGPKPGTIDGEFGLIDREDALIEGHRDKQPGDGI